MQIGKIAGAVATASALLVAFTSTSLAAEPLPLLPNGAFRTVSVTRWQPDRALLNRAAKEAGNDLQQSRLSLLRAKVARLRADLVDSELLLEESEAFQRLR